MTNIDPILAAALKGFVPPIETALPDKFRQPTCKDCGLYPRQPGSQFCSPACAKNYRDVLGS